MSTSPIGRKLAVSFAVVSLLAAAQCIVHVLLIGHVATEVARMQGDEKAIREGLELSKAVREQYIHAAHTIAQGDHSHLDRYTEWVARVRDTATRFARLEPAEEKQRLESIVEASRRFDASFRLEIVPAVDRGDREAMRAAHNRVEPVLARAGYDADDLVRRFERRMSRAHVSTTQTTRIGLALAIGGIALIVAVAVVSTLQIQRAVIGPLAKLKRAALEIGQGNFQGEIGDVGEGEFRELAQAFERMSAEIRQREARLVHSERMAAIGQLAAGIAHEINNPIGVIRGYLRTMLPEARDHALREELKILDEEATACQRIAEDLFTYARLPELKRERVLIDQLIEDTLHRFASTDEGGRAEISADVGPQTLEVDPVRMRQLVSNLVKNAIEAGSREVLVLGQKTDTNEYTVRILDRGPGIKEAERQRIFEPFFSGQRGGTGLGLAVCQGIVKAHGGTIGAYPREGGGSELVFTLPIERGAPKLTPFPSVGPDQGAQSSSESSGRMPYFRSNR